MNIRIKSLIALAVYSALGVSAANALPVMNDDTGHYYEVFISNGITWPDAKTDVESLHCINPDGSTDPRVDATTCTSSLAVLPHLATITSSREDEFVEGLRQDVVPAVGEVWVGGFQNLLEVCAPPVTAAQCGWTWVNNEGGFPGDNGGPEYANWQISAGEPNDAYGPDSEIHLAIGLFGPGLGWNDEGAPAIVDGYVVEWDVPRPLEDCDDAAGCVTVEGHTLEFPAGSLPPTGGTLSFNSFEILDPRVAAGDCGTEVLQVLGSTGIGPATAYPMIIPKYLCGSPKFIVITVDIGAFAITEGTLLVTNDTIVALPGNEYPDGGKSVCEDPITQLPYTDGDPQYQDVVVWQSTDPDKMLEQTYGPIIEPSLRFEGAAGEFTFDCGGSSRGRTRGNSYFGIGFHIDFGPGNTWAGNSAGNFGHFVDLTRYKLKLLQQALENAKNESPTAIPKKGDREKMTNQVKNAIKNFDAGNYDDALDHVNNFLKFADKADYTIIPEENHQGELLMRGGNIEFMLRVKIIPYAP